MVISNNEVLNIMPPQYGLFGLLFAFMNRLQETGDSFYDEIRTVYKIISRREENLKGHAEDK